MAASTSTIEVNKEITDDITRILNGLSLNTPSAPKEEAAAAESSPAATYGSSRFDELGNFKFGNKAPKFAGKCFLQIGEVTQHNIVVSYFFSMFLSLLYICIFCSN